MAIVVNKPIPEFEANATGGIKVTNTSHLGQVLVLYFYPKDNTPGCTLEGQEFTTLYKEFAKAGADIVGVSKDSVKAHDNFCAKYGFPYSLLSDKEGELCEAFGAWVEKSMYGRKYMGIDRSTFLFDAKGVLKQDWRKVSAKGHAAAVLEAVKAL